MAVAMSPCAECHFAAAVRSLDSARASDARSR